MRALRVAPAGLSHRLARVRVRALPEATVDAVQSAVDRDTGIGGRSLALARRDVLGVTLTRAVVAPGSGTTVRAELLRAVESSKARLAPASATKAETVIRTIIQTLRLAAVGSSQLRRALTYTVDTGSRATAALGARLNGAVGTGKALFALTRPIHTASSGLAVISAGFKSAIHACGATGAVASAIVAVAAV